MVHIAGVPEDKMKISNKVRLVFPINFSVIVSLSLLLASCGGGGGVSGSNSNQTSPPLAPPLIQALILSFPTGAAPANMPTAMVTITDGSTGVPISNARVTVNGVALTYNGAPAHLEYEGMVAINPGTTVTLVVQTDGNIYSATNSQITTYPVVSAPVSGDTWLTGNTNTITWSGGAPLAGASYFLFVADVTDPAGGTPFMQMIGTGTNSFSVWPNALTTGNYDVILGLSTLVSISNADLASYLVVGGYGYAPVTVIPIAAPSNIQPAGSGDQQAVISWDAVTGATSYNIYWSTTAANANKALGTKITGATSPYVHTVLNNGTAYYYTVTAVGAYGEGPESSVVTVIPGAPVNVTALPGNAQATINWPAVTGAISYDIYWSLTAASANKVAGTNISGAVSPYVQSGLTNGTPYYCVITGVYAAGESSESSLFKVIPGSLLRGGAVQGYPPGLSNTVSTLAPHLPGHAFNMATDGNNLYLPDPWNNVISKVEISTGAISTIAGTATAGLSCGAADGTGAGASFCQPRGITTDGTSLYIADTTNRIIRKMVISTGAVTTLAGQTGISGSSNGTGTGATFNWPLGITTDGTNLYVTDVGNGDVRKIVIATAAVTTVAPPGLWSPTAITTDGTNLYVTDTLYQNIKKVVIATGAVTTLAGSSTAGIADGIGTAAAFDQPQGITTDGTNLYVADTNNRTIRKIVILTGEVTTLAGSAVSAGDFIDGNGAAARFRYPQGITTDGSSLFVTDDLNNVIRKVQ